ncbi:ABC transporter permease [candidate division KSB1 bacterium]
MSNTPDISLFSMALCFLLLVIPAAMSYYLKLGVTRELVTAVIRMSVQLLLVGVFLEYLFDLNNPVVTTVWLIVMITFASYSVIKNSVLSRKLLLLPTLGALLLTTLTILAYFNAFIIRLDNIFDARFAIAIGGMLLGNAMRGTIVGVNDFYRTIKRDSNRYLYTLAQGATMFEAGSPYVRNSLNAAVKPSLASMATMGIVFLPGMMTGQIIGGSSPVVAIKYQIAIMIVIFTATILSIGLSILFTMRASFDEFGILRKEIFTA